MGDVDKWLSNLKNDGKILSERDLKCLCEKIKEILIEESNVQPVSAPVIVCGDIHGQFYDLMELFNTGWEIPNSKYVFLGDYRVSDISFFFLFLNLLYILFQ